MAVAPTALDYMKERIRRACTEITPHMLAEVRRSFHQRIKRCSQVEGRPKPRLLDPLKVIITIYFDFSTIFILRVTRMTLCCRLLNSS